MSDLELERAEEDAADESDLRTSVSRLMRGLNHDLKNPLGAADGYLDLMLQGFRGELSEEQRQTLERIRELIASGVSILEDVVTFTRASLGELRVGLVDSDLGTVTRMALDAHKERAQEADVALEFGGDAEARVVTDPDLVAQIVDRVVANALDNTPEGGRIDVSLGREAGAVLIRVKDDGVGIPAEDRDRLFREFERGPAPVRPRVTSGIGFGLPLARALATRLGGTLELESEPGAGTTVTLALPVRAASA